MCCREVQDEQRERSMYGLRGGLVLGGCRSDCFFYMYFVSCEFVLGRCRCECFRDLYLQCRVHRCKRRCLLGVPGGIVQGADRQRGVRAVSEQYIFRGCRPELVVRAVPGERGVCVGQRVTDVLLLQERVCACGGDVDVQDL